MAIFKEILPGDIKTARSFLSQLVDVLQEDIATSSSRRKYQVFVTGGLGPGVTSSLYQTVYDQDFTLQTANPIFDITVGLNPSSDIVDYSKTGEDAAGKETFLSSSLMMREKMDIYRQFSQNLLGSSDRVFSAPFNSENEDDQIDAALFMSFRRLFTRDQIKRQTFAMRFFQTASHVENGVDTGFGPPADPADGITNLFTVSPSGSAVYTDVGSSVNKIVAENGGNVGNIVDSSNINNNVGLVFYDRGIAVFDLEKITSGSQFMSGTIDAVNNNGYEMLGGAGTETALTAKFIPDFFVSGSVDNIVDHISACRFGDGSLSAVTFQNITNINSSLIFCRAGADEFNYSSNPSFVDDEDRIVVIDEGQEDIQQTFTFITTVGLYDANDNLLAVAKLSRPIEKSPERDLTLRVRLDF